MTRATLGALLAVPLIAGGCLGLTEVSCTLIGCDSVLTIAFSSPPSVPYHIEALSVDGGRAEFDCPDPTKCASAEFHDYSPDKAVLTVTTATGSAQYNVAPDYTPRYANGKRCGVTCRSATVTVTLP
jgi:hypothetical protein